MKRVLFLLCFFSALSGWTQVTSFFQAQFNGGVTACGYGPDYCCGGTGKLTLYIAPYSSIYKAWLFAGREGEAPPVTVTLNGSPFTFDSTNVVSDTFYSVDYGGTSAVHAVDVTSVIDSAVNTYTLTIPEQESLDNRFQDFYLYVAYSNKNMRQITSCIFLNAANFQGLVIDTFLMNYPVYTGMNVGMAIYMGYACSMGDDEGIEVNGTNLGNIGGANMNAGGCAGPFGDFYYQNGTLIGLLDCDSNQAMNGPDALANIRRITTNCTNQVIGRFTHIDQDNALWGFFFTYSTGLPGNYDTTVCSGNPIQLNIAPGSIVVWDPSPTLSCDSCNNPIATPLLTTTYIANINGAGCAPATDSITVTLSPSVALFVPDTNVCFGDTVSIVATPTVPGGNYLWSPGGDTTNIISVNPLNNTIYTVVYESPGCGSATGSSTVTINPVPAVTVNSQTICVGDTAVLIAHPNTTGGTYFWSPSGHIGDTLIVAPGESLTFDVTFTAVACGTSTDSARVNVMLAPSVQLNYASFPTACIGQSVTLAATPSMNGGTYTWNPGAEGDTTGVILVTPDSTTLYTVTYTTSCGTASASAQVSIDTPGLSLMQMGMPCSGGTAGIQVTPIGGAPPYDYALNGGLYQLPDTFGNLSIGFYTVTINDYYGCKASDTITLASYPPVIVTISADTTQLCSGDTAYICATSGLSSYRWNTGISNTCIHVIQSGNYYVIASNQNNCTAESNQVMINVHPADTISVSNAGDTLTASPDLIYQWYFNGIAVPGATSQIYIADSTGNYYLVATDSFGCSTKSSDVYVSLNAISNVKTDSFEVYPNPLLQGVWHLLVGENAIGAPVEITDSKGSLVYKQNISYAQTEVKLDIAPGIYLLRITLHDNCIVKKLIRL